MFEPTGRPRTPALRPLRRLRAPSRSPTSTSGARKSDLSFRDQGITFGFSGEDRPFPLDPIPRLVSSAEWATIEQGVAQRVRALEMFLADAYGPQEAFNEGVVPRHLLATSRHFWRNAFGVGEPERRPDPRRRDRPREGRPAVSSACSRTTSRIPSGMSYVIENRRSDGAYVPELLLKHRVQPVSGYPAQLPTLLRASAPRAAGNEPNVVVLTPGVANSAYFEHSFLARQMGVELVEGPRPRVPRQRGLHAHDGGPTARRRHLPACRRRLPRPGAVPLRLIARLRRVAERGAGGQRHGRQRHRQRNRRRQARVHLRP